MANLDAVSMIIILFVCMIIALVIGYFIGNLSGRSGNKAALREKQKHDELKEDVREHFRQTSALMTRMAQDYREMQQHMSDGAERLAGIQDEKSAAAAAPEQVTQSSGRAGEAIEQKPSAEVGEAAARSEHASESETTPGQAGDDDRNLADRVKEVAQEVTEKPASNDEPEPARNATAAESSKSKTKTSGTPQPKHVQVGTAGRK